MTEAAEADHFAYLLIILLARSHKLSCVTHTYAVHIFTRSLIETALCQPTELRMAEIVYPQKGGHTLRRVRSNE